MLDEAPRAPRRRQSVEMLDEGDDEDNYKPRNKSLSSKVSHILERADGSDNPDDGSDEDMPGLAPAYDSDDEDGDEDKDMEEWEEYDIRAPLEGLELAHLRVLQANSIHRVHQQPTCPCLRVRCQGLQGTWQWS